MRQRIMEAVSLVQPVIKVQQCTGCKTCIKHCKNDVLSFDRSSRKIRVKGSRGCRVECRTCARVCPTGAVSFPDEEAFVRYLNNRLDQIKEGLAHVDDFLATKDLRTCSDRAR